MSLTTPFEEARAALGLDPAEQDPAIIKQAYRRAVAAHPPDLDPDAFRRIRDAYELLRDPWARAKDILHSPLPQVPPPAPPAEPVALPRRRGGGGVAPARGEPRRSGDVGDSRPCQDSGAGGRRRRHERSSLEAGWPPGSTIC